MARGFCAAYPRVIATSLGKDKHAITLWLVVCHARVDDDKQLCFRSQIWTAFQMDPLGMKFEDDPLVESITDVRQLDTEFNSGVSPDAASVATAPASTPS